jgi:hypothetical protein
MGEHDHGVERSTIGAGMSEPRSREQRSASGDLDVPDRPDEGVTAGNDPTDGGSWIRRRVVVQGTSAVSLDEAADTVLQLPGVATATLTDDGLIIDMRPDVLADQELEAAFDRADLEVSGWTDEPLGSSPQDR